MEHFFDPSYDPYQWLWDFLQPLTGRFVSNDFFQGLPEPVQVGLLNPTNVGMVILLILGLALMRAGGGKRGREERPSKQVEEPAYEGSLRIGLGFWRGLWWRVRPISRKYRWQVGAYRISTRRKHAGIVGATGSRKSTLAAELVDGTRPTLILTGEPSDPLRAAVWDLMQRTGKAMYWSPNGDLGWDMLQGDAMETAERLTAGTKKSEGDTGLGRGIVQDVVYAALTACDLSGRRRTWADIDAALDELEATAKAERDTNKVGAAQRWRDRFKHARLALADSLGTDLDIEAEMRAGNTVMMEMSSMRSPESTPWTAANILLDGKRAANKVKGGRLLVDEGWAFKERKGEIAELVRAGRRLGWEVYFMTQLPQDYSDEMLGNMRTWVFLMQVGTNVSALEWCSRAVHRRLPSEAFSEGALKEGEGYLLTDGFMVKIKIPIRKIENLAETLPNLRKPGVKEKTDPGPLSDSEFSDPGQGSGTRWEVVEVPSWVADDAESEEAEQEGYVAGPAALVSGTKCVPTCILGNERRFQIFSRLRGTWTEEADWLWPEDAGRNRGYGKTSYLNVSGWETHFLFWAWRVLEDHELGRSGDLEKFYARHPEVPRFIWPESKDELVTLRALKIWMREQDPKLSIDHGCPGFPNTLCANYRHLSLVTETENSQLRHSRRKGSGRMAAEKARVA